MKKTQLFILIFTFTLTASAQLDRSVERDIDRLFIEWNRPNHPGGVVGIVQDGNSD